MKFVKNYHVILLFMVSFLLMYEVKYLKEVEKYVFLSDIGNIKNEISELRVSINNLNSEKSKLVREISVNNNLPDTTKNKLLKLENEINIYKSKAGLTNVEGEGVILIIDDADRVLNDNELPTSLMVHDLDLRVLVDVLKNNGAEAISVNEVRIVDGFSKIVCNGPIISINDIEQAQPYIIKAIGDRYKLYNALMSPESPASTLKKIGLKLEIETQKNTVINKYKDYNLEF